MYGSNRQFTEQYRKVGVQSSVTDADPHKLVALLLAGACERLRLALACLERGDQARKGKAIGEVCAIVGTSTARWTMRPAARSPATCLRCTTT